MERRTDGAWDLLLLGQIFVARWGSPSGNPAPWNEEVHTEPLGLVGSIGSEPLQAIRAFRSADFHQRDCYPILVMALLVMLTFF
jgi:hypothetical protein